MENEVRQALVAEGFADEEIQLEETASGKVSGFVVSTQFEGKTQLDRQDFLWAHLRNRLKDEQLIQIIAILTMTPEETRVD